MAGRQHNPLRLAVTIVSGVIYAVSAAAAVPLVWVAVERMRAGRFESALLWGLAVFALLVGVMVWFVLAGLLNLQIDTSEEAARLHRTTRAAADRQAQILADVVERLDGLAHWTALSESTRSLLVRRREQDVFVKQIETAIDEGDWTEANRLTDLFADHFDNEPLAEQLRQRMGSARGAADERVIRARIAEVRSMIDALNFPSAELALGRLANDFPTEKRLDDLRSTFLRARRRHGEALQDRFGRLLGERRMEEALALLDELGWLERDALGALREQWKETFRQAQHEARDAFSAAVKARQWTRAGELGEQILDRYADSSLAGEVRKLIEGIRRRARGEPGGEAQPIQVDDRKDEAAGGGAALPAAEPVARPEPPGAGPVAPPVRSVEPQK